MCNLKLRERERERENGSCGQEERVLDLKHEHIIQVLKPLTKMIVCVCVRNA